MYVSSSAARFGVRWGRAARIPPRNPSRGLLYWVFIHVIHNGIGRPGTDRHIDRFAQFVVIALQLGHGDRAHLDEAATVNRFDLEDFALGDDFTRFFVGSATKSGSCTEDSLEDKHGVVSLSG